MKASSCQLLQEISSGEISGDAEYGGICCVSMTMREISICEISCREGDGCNAGVIGKRLHHLIPVTSDLKPGTFDLGAKMFEGPALFLNQMQFLRVEAMAQFSYRRRNFRGNSICLS
jgi:hypothetical protein